MIQKRMTQSGEPRIPHRLRMGSAELANQFAQARVGHHRDVCRRVAGVDVSASTAFDQRDRLAGHLKQVRRRETGDTTADDDNVDVEIAVDRREARKRR